jgi:glycine/D-amino acid oxidase-like deaminating enzyme
MLRAAKLDAKTVIHNYGHGGSGMSLSWGTGQIAAEMALEHGERRAAVLGCGAVGLTAARQLQRRGFDVTIYAMSVPPDTTSNMSLAGFTPTSGLIEPDRHTPEWDAQFVRAAEISYRQLQLLAGPHYGISWIDSYSPADTAPTPPSQGGNDFLPNHLRTGQVVLEPGEHPFPSKYAIRRVFMRIEPSIYLDALVRDFILFGGRIVIRKFDTPRDLMTLTEGLIVNSTGLGAGALFGDSEVVPVKGQLTHLVPQPEITYRASGGGGGQGVGMNPRSDGIALSGTSERGVWSLEPNEEARQRIVGNAIQFFTAMREVNGGVRVTRAPDLPRDIPKLEAFFDLES